MTDKRDIAMEQIFTYGTWRWFVHGPDGLWYLATEEWGRIVVMDFVRHGMRAAKPRFGVRPGYDAGGVMRPIDELGPVVHPDARLLAAAPKLLRALVRTAERIDGDGIPCWCPIEYGIAEKWLHRPYCFEARAALAEAVGNEGRLGPLLLHIPDFYASG